ncbi:MAG: hypothetical protein SV186_06995 [Candidatus Nanohaloarchaea archaeon]|nr:hypothetical protein [Candidatus Nanohaloarchaea archaeon]
MLDDLFGGDDDDEERDTLADKYLKDTETLFDDDDGVYGTDLEETINGYTFDGSGLDDDAFYETMETGYEKETNTELKTIDPVTTTPDTTGAGLPSDRGTSKAERRETFRDEYEDAVQDAVTADRLLEVAASEVDASPAAIHDALTEELGARGSDLIDEIRPAIVDAAEERYVKDHMFYNDRVDDLAHDAVEETVDDLLPTHRLRDGVEKVYDGAELDPRAIQRHLVRRMADDVEATVTEYDEAAAAMIEGERLTAEASPEQVENGLPGSLAAMESKAGETVMGVRWDSSHPSVQRAAADQLQEAVGKDIQRAATGAADASKDELEALQDGYRNAIERFRVDETLAALERHWGTADMPYEVYKIDNPDEMQQAAQDIGNCRRHATDYYEDLADDPFTTILGVRRDDEDEWIGMARAFHLDADGDDVFAIDNLGMQYKDGQEGGHPDSACNFEEFGDALPVMGLASIAYGLENGFDYVVAGRNDGRVGGGSGDRIGVAQLYSTKNTDESELPVEKKGHRDIERPYGLTELTYSADQHFALLLENPS